MDDNKYEKISDSIYDKVRELRGKLNVINLKLSDIYDIVDNSFSLSHEPRKDLLDSSKATSTGNNFTLHDLIEGMIETEKEIRRITTNLNSLVTQHLRDPKIQDPMMENKN